MLEALALAGRQLSTATVLFHQAVAESVGLNATDHKCLDILNREGPMPAGRLADITGLTTGAITSIVDRLERAGFVRREKDPADRRKVIVKPVEEEAIRRLGPIFDAFRDDLEELHAPYSDEELALVLDYLNRSTDLARNRTRRLRGIDIPERYEI